MTPKEKTEELVNRFITEGCLFANAKQCALICVDEIIDSVKYTFPSAEFLNYWQQVKTEIEKL